VGLVGCANVIVEGDLAVGTSGAGGAAGGGAAGSGASTTGTTGSLDPPWSKRFGDPADQGVPRGMVVSPSGDIVLRLVLGSAADFGGPPSTGALVSLDPGGSPRWAIPMPDLSDPVPLAVDGAGNIYVAGAMYQQAADFGCGAVGSDAGATSSALLVKLSPSGQCSWSRAWPGGSFSALAVDADGSIAVGGTATGPLDLGTGVIDPWPMGFVTFLAKLDPQGNGIWSMATVDSAAIDCLAAATGGDILVGGTADVVVSLGIPPTTAMAKGPSVLAARLTADGAPMYVELFDDAYLIDRVACGTDGAGDLVLEATLQYGSAVDFGGGAIDAMGDLPFLVELDASGGYRWQASYPNPSGNSAVGVQALATDAHGSVVWTGGLIGTYDFGTGTLSNSSGNGNDPDWIAVRYEPNGAVRWARRYGAGGWQSSFAVALDPEGAPVVAGSAMGGIDFGQGTLAAIGKADVLVVKLPP
jgi:hypothetical protein